MTKPQSVWVPGPRNWDRRNLGTILSQLSFGKIQQIVTGPHYFFHWDWTSLLLSLGLDLITSLSRLLVDHCSTQWLNNQGIHLPKRCFSCAWLSSTFHQEKTSTQMTHPRDLTHHDHDHDDAADAEDDNDDYDVVWCSMVVYADIWWCMMYDDVVWCMVVYGDDEWWFSSPWCNLIIMIIIIIIIMIVFVHLSNHKYKHLSNTNYQTCHTLCSELVRVEAKLA